MGLRMKNVNIMGGSLKNLIFRGGSPKKRMYRGNCLKKGGGLGQFLNLRRVLHKKGGGCFWGGGLIPNAHYAWLFEKSISLLSQGL